MGSMIDLGSIPNGGWRQTRWTDRLSRSRFDQLLSRRLPQYNSAGFTLLELLVVIAIIAVLTSYVAPRFLGSVGKSEVQAARAQLDALGKALDSFRLDVGRYPTQAEGLEVLVSSPAVARGWRGPYLKKDIPVDPWGKSYQYQVPSTSGLDFDLYSFGRDGSSGGTDDAADIYLP